MQAQTAARFEDILAHVTLSLTGAGSTGTASSRLLPIWDQTRVYGTRGGLATPETGGRLRAPPGFCLCKLEYTLNPTSRPPLAVREVSGRTVG
jgi:hypothetical protein